MEMKNVQEFYSPLSFSPSSSSPSFIIHPLDIGAEEWEVAERKVHKILSAIQPTAISEHKRKGIIEYIQILFGATYGIKVLPFGSVPLKTYLPDEGIDLTALCLHDEDSLSGFFCSLLQNEEMINSQVQVRNVHFVPAQIKVIKCHVEGIAVEITFNQMTGICALSFFDQVDQLIGLNHLFKRSVLLIKAWCFYEGRLFGARYGLISTYALETMIAHIINLFHSSLHSPFAVLYKFVGYYSKFDWEKYCVAINGLVLVSSLPRVVAELPSEADDMLLSAKFLLKCRESYFLSTGLNPTGGRPFHQKYFNVVDPLRENNNLGHGVNKANFKRIKFAFSMAIKKLDMILASPVEEINEGIEMLFETMLGSSDKEQLSDGIHVPELIDGRSAVYENLGDDENLLAGIQYGLWSHDFGLYQGFDYHMNAEIWTKWNQLGLAGHYDVNVLFQLNQNLAQLREARNFSTYNQLSAIGEITKPRGTGTYIPLVQVSSSNSAENGTMLCSPILSEMPELLGNEVNNVFVENPSPPAMGVGCMNEYPDLSGLRLEDTSEFPPLLGNPQKGAYGGK